jgi:hypothetical protein
MATISSLPDILNVVEGDYIAYSYIAGAAIGRGQVCSLDSNGRAIPQPITGTPNPPIGVAQDAAAQYQPVSCVWEGKVKVINSSDSVAIAVGATVKVSAYAGCVAATTTYTDTQIVGRAVEAIPASGSGYILLTSR